MAASHKAVAGLVEAIAHGQPVPTITMDMIHEGNAAHAAQHANCTKAETLALLRQNGAAAVATVRGLGDTELDRTVTFPMGTLTAAQVVERVLIGHADDHHGTIRKAIAAPDGVRLDFRAIRRPARDDATGRPGPVGGR